MRIALGALLIAAAAATAVRAEAPVVPQKPKPVAKVGQPAPDFSLPGLRIDPDSGATTQNPAKPFRLAEHAGKRPVVLIFPASREAPASPGCKPWRPCAVSTGRRPSSGSST
jgi:hypothetical protein